jgi:autotransporter passenger strand-loop-strand repeat protein
VPGNTISGWTPGDIIDLTSVGYDSSGTAHLLSNNVLEITESSGTFDLNLDQHQLFLSEQFGLTSDGSGGTEVVLTQTPLTSAATVTSGFVVYGVTLGAGGALNVASGATASGTNVSASGSVIVQAGGTVSGGTVSSGGKITISNGGSAAGATVSDGGQQIVYAGGSANNTLLTDPGVQIVSSGGFANGAIVSGGEQDVYAFGSALSTTVMSGYDSATKANVVGFQNVFSGGHVASTTVSLGGEMVVSTGGVASAATISAGGSALIKAGGVESGTTVGSSGTELVFGSSVDATVTNGGSLTISTGGTAINTTVSSGGTVSLSGGTESGGTVNASGTLLVLSGGSTVSTSLIGGGVVLSVPIFAQEILSGGSATGTTISSTGQLIVSSGGVATGTVVTGTSFGSGLDGGLVVSNGGSAGGTILLNGGIELVLSGGIDSAATVSSGGLLHVGSGGEAINPTASGGTLTIDVNGIIQTTSFIGASYVEDATLNNAGQLLVHSASQLHLSGEVHNSGGTVSVDAANGYSATLYVDQGASNEGLTLDGGGHFTLSDDPNNNVYGQSGGSKLTNVDNTITGAGTFGNSSLTLDNQAAGIINANGSNALTLSPGTLTNEGLIEATGTGGLVIQSASAIVNNGTLEADGGTLTDNSAVTGGGSALIKGGGQANFLATFNQNVTFAGAGTLDLSQTTGYSGTVSGFGTTDKIDLKSIANVAGSHADMNYLTNMLTVSEGSNSYQLKFNPTESFAGDFFHLASDKSGSGPGTLITEDHIACYCPGTLIQTKRGQRKVEKLKIGDQVMTASGVTRPIKWIGRRSYGGRFIMGRKDILPVCIKVGALDIDVPKRDLWISPHHAMYFKDADRGGLLIEAKDLVNGATIVQAESVEKVEYIHLELDSHDVIIAEGALSETFVDDDSRGMFHNGHEFRALYPDVPPCPAQYCAPRRSEGYEVEAVRAQIDQRAELRPAAENPHGLRGYIDLVTTQLIAGWAQNVDYPEAPVCLDIYAAGRLIGQTLANRYREDLQRAGLGSGSHSFEFVPPAWLKFGLHTIEVRRSLDGEPLAMSHTLARGRHGTSG